MNYLRRFRLNAALAAMTLLQVGACTGNIIPPDPGPSPSPSPAGTMTDVACPTMIPDQATNICPRLKNISLTCGGNGMLHTSISGGSGNPFIVGVKLDDGSMLSAVLVVVNCSDGPREAVTFGVTYTGQVSIPNTGPPCISQSKAVYSQFLFGNPLYAVFEGLAKDKMHQTFDEQAISKFTSTLGLAMPATPRCSFWREMP